jgi:hypothetical protein
MNHYDLYGFNPQWIPANSNPGKINSPEAALCHVTKAEAGIQKSKLDFSVSSTGQAYQVRHNI